MCCSPRVLPHLGISVLLLYSKREIDCSLVVNPTDLLFVGTKFILPSILA